MIRIRLRIWPDGKLVEQMCTEYDDKGHVTGMWGMMHPATVRDFPAYQSPAIPYRTT